MKMVNTKSKKMKKKNNKENTNTMMHTYRKKMNMKNTMNMIVNKKKKTMKTKMRNGYDDECADD